MNNSNKVCVDLIVPAIEERYNVFIPVNKKTLEIIFLLNKAITDMTDGAFPSSDSLSLINADDGSIYDVENTVLQNHILNGAKIILL